MVNRRMIGVPIALGLMFSACAPTPEGIAPATPEGIAPAKAQQQTPPGCGGDQGMATQFYQNLDGTPRMASPPTNCP